MNGQYFNLHFVCALNYDCFVNMYMYAAVKTTSICLQEWLKMNITQTMKKFCLNVMEFYFFKLQLKMKSGARDLEVFDVVVQQP